MDFSPRCNIFPMFRVFVWFLILVFSISSIQSLGKDKINQANRTSEATQEDLKKVKDYLMKINKPGVKTIKSPDGDIIDCVLFHQQPAFDHPALKGQKLLDPPEISKGHNLSVETNENFQLWSMSGESCPEGTVPIRRVTEEDVLYFGNISTFGRKKFHTSFTDDDHEYAFVYVNKNKFYGGKAQINVWTPTVEDPSEFSLAQMWITAGPREQLNTIEAGWQVYPQRHRGDRRPRFFIYWTKDNYETTGCYNFVCSGFVQTSQEFVPGAAIRTTSSYGGLQQAFRMSIYKDAQTGNWWLQYGDSLVGYWPSVLFTYLRFYANTVKFGGEIINSGGVDGSHSSTQMGSGHFAEEGDGKAAFFRNVEVAKELNTFTPENPKVGITHPNCYNLEGGFDQEHGYNFYYGGPGRNPRCP